MQIASSPNIFTAVLLCHIELIVNYGNGHFCNMNTLHVFYGNLHTNNTRLNDVEGDRMGKSSCPSGPDTFFPSEDKQLMEFCTKKKNKNSGITKIRRICRISRVMEHSKIWFQSAYL